MSPHRFRRAEEEGERGSLHMIYSLRSLLKVTAEHGPGVGVDFTERMMERPFIAFLCVLGFSLSLFAPHSFYTRCPLVIMTSSFHATHPPVLHFPLSAMPLPSLSDGEQQNALLTPNLSSRLRRIPCSSFLQTFLSCASERTVSQRVAPFFSAPSRTPCFS